MILLDVNVLIYAFWPGAPSHAPIKNWLDDAVNGSSPVLLSDIVLSGFVRIITGGKLVAVPEPLENALNFCEQLLGAPACRLVRTEPAHWARFTTLCRRVRATGNLVPDSFLAALAIENNAEFVTCDRDFRRFPGLTWRHPMDAAAITNSL
jgi:toxin-antitoxin system PIN domain toxin